MSGNKFDALRERFKSEDDIALINEQEEAYKRSKEISQLIQGPGGEKIISFVKGEIVRFLSLLFSTREDRYISDLESYFNLLTTLTGAEDQKETISKWLESKE